VTARCLPRWPAIAALVAALLLAGCLDPDNAAPSGWQCNCIKSSA
jgi:hypothetical protein